MRSINELSCFDLVEIIIDDNSVGIGIVKSISVETNEVSFFKFDMIDSINFRCLGVVNEFTSIFSTKKYNKITVSQLFSRYGGYDNFSINLSDIFPENEYIGIVLSREVSIVGKVSLYSRNRRGVINGVYLQNCLRLNQSNRSIPEVVTEGNDTFYLHITGFENFYKVSPELVQMLSLASGNSEYTIGGLLL